MKARLHTVLDSLEECGAFSGAAVQRRSEAIAIVREMMEAEPVAWADNSAMQGMVGNVCSASAKRYWEKSDWADQKNAELHRHPLYAAPFAPAPTIKQSLTVPDASICMVPIRQLFDHEGNQVCSLGDETCHFYVLPKSGGLCGASCNHCQRGIPNNKPHRLCPVLYESKK